MKYVYLSSLNSMHSIIGIPTNPILYSSIALVCWFVVLAWSNMSSSQCFRNSALEIHFCTVTFLTVAYLSKSMECLKANFPVIVRICICMLQNRTLWSDQLVLLRLLFLKDVCVPEDSSKCVLFSFFLMHRTSQDLEICNWMLTSFWNLSSVVDSFVCSLFWTLSGAHSVQNPD